MTHTNTGSALIEEITNQTIPAGSVGVWWLGQASLVLKTGEEIIYVDPYLAASDRRLTPPAFAPQEGTNATLILLTHDHIDHIDPDTLPALAQASPAATLITSRPTVQRVVDLVGDSERVLAAEVDQPLTHRSLTITPVPAKHEEFDEDPDLGYPYLGYVLQIAGGPSIYLAGDTIPYEGMIERLQPMAIDLAFLPINGRDFFRTRAGTIGNMDGREASDIAEALDVETVVPVHYGMFAGNTVPPGNFVTHLAQHYPERQAHILGRYRAWLYTSPRR